jgi:hypothetical protein
MEMKITAKSFADFATATPTRKRTILKNAKHPKKKENQIIILYYNEALRVIKLYHKKGNDQAVIKYALRRLRQEREASDKPQKKARLNQNIRAIESYFQLFGQRKFEVLPSPRLKLTVGKVTISATPDLMVKESGTLHLIKVGVVKQKLHPDLVPIMLDVILDAAIKAEISIDPANVMYLDLTNENIIRAAKNSTSIRRTVQNACDDVESMWQNIP